MDFVRVPDFGFNPAVNREWQTCTGGSGAESGRETSRDREIAAAHRDRARAAVREIHAAVADRPAWAERIFPKELRARFSIPQTLEVALRDALLETSWATPIRRRDGIIREWCLIPSGPAAIPLRTLVRDLPATDDGGGAGRKGQRGRESLTGLTVAQRKAALSLATLLEGAGAAAGLDPRDGPALLARPDFPRRVGELSDASARDDAARAGRPWSPATNTMRPKLIGAAQNLQALAGRLGLVATRPAAPEAFPTAPAAALVPLLERFRRKLDGRDADGGNALRIDAGLRALGRVLTQLGWLEWTQIEPVALRDRIEALRAEDAFTDTTYYAIRHVWRRIHSLHGLAPLVAKTTPSSLFSLSLVTSALAARGHVMSVELASGPPHVFPRGEELLGGRLGLRRLIRFLSAAPHLLRPGSDLPVHRINVAQLRRADRYFTVDATLAAFASPGQKCRTAGALSDATVMGLCEPLRRLAQLVHDADPGADLGLSSILRLSVVENVAQRCGWITTDERHQGVLNVTGKRVVEQAAVAAWGLAQLAVHDGERDVARQLLEARAALLDWRLRLDPEGDRGGLTLKKVIEIDTAWRGSDNVPGFIKLGRLRDCVAGRAVKAAGLSLEGQVRCLSTGERPQWLRPTWAIAIRNALLIHLLRMMPLRSREVVKLTRAMFVATKDGRSCDIWTPGSRVASLIPAAIMKSNRPREAVLAEPHDDATTESRFCRPLFALYLMPGGARDVLGAQGDLMFVSNHGMRMRPASISRIFMNESLRHADHLCMTREVLRSLYGAIGLHAIRALVGRYVAHDLDRVLQATVVLHHRDVRTTINKYVGLSGRYARLTLPN